MHERRFDEIVSALYEAASGRGAWRAPLDAIAAEFDASRCVVASLARPDLRPVFRHEGGRVETDAVCDAVRRDPGADPLVARLLHQPVARWLFDAGAPDDRAVDCAAGALVPAGMALVAGVRLADDGDEATLAALAGGRRRRPLDAAGRRALERLGFHLLCALAVDAQRLRLPGADTSGVDPVAGGRHPWLLVDAHRRIRFRNAAADAMLAARSPCFERAGRLHCVDPADDAELLCALLRLDLDGGERAVEPPARTVLRVGRPDDDPSAIFLSRRVDDADPGPLRGPPALARLLFHRTRQSAEPDPTLVAELFALTPAEAKVAAQLAQGLSADQIAAGRGVSTQTVRAQIRAVFDKTGSNRQADLIRLLVEMPDAPSVDGPTVARTLAGPAS